MKDNKTSRGLEADKITMRTLQAAQSMQAGSLKVLCSPYSGAVIELLHTVDLIIGTDPDECGLIVSGTGISRKHCFLSYNALSGTYLLMDVSRNGTYLAKDRRLPKNFLIELEPETEFYLSEPENRFKVG